MSDHAITHPAAPPRRLHLATAFMLVLTLMCGILIAQAAFVPDAAEAATYTIVNTDGDGVRQRNAPKIAAAWSGVAPEGASISTICQIWGDAVGRYNNKLWLKVKRGNVSFYIADTYTNSPRYASDPMLPGIPKCGTTSTVQGPTSTYKSVAVGTTKTRYCTNTTLTGCATRKSIPSGTGLKMHCYQDDSKATERYASNRWFYVTSRSGVRGFVHSSRVDTQTSVGRCQDHHGVAPSRWAAMQTGRTAPRSSETNGTGATGWSGWCYLFAYDAHVHTGGATPWSGGSAKQAFYAYQQAGATSTYSVSRTSIGSIVFWTSGGYGHAAVYIGDGMVATTRGNEGDGKAIEIVAVSTFGTPAGVVVPNALAKRP
jgi:hypothetical protein